MKKKYLYNGEYYTEAEMTDFAKQSGVSFDSYIAALGKDVKVLDAPYEYKGNFYTQDEISAAAKKKGINDDAYLSQNGIKKKEEAYTGGAMSSAASKIGGQVGNFVGQSEKDNALSLIQSINAGITKGIEKGKQQFPNEIRATPEEEAALRDAQRRTGQADGLFTQQGAEQFNLLATDPLRAILDPEREKLQTAYNNRRLQGVRQTSDNTIARNNIDPNKTVQKKDGKLIPDVSSNPEYQVKNQEQALENVSGLVKNKFFKNGKEALEYAENQVKSGIDPTGNETIEHAITKAGEYKQKEESALNGKSIIQNAIEIQLQNDPLFKKQYETIINGTASDAEIADVARRFNIPLDKLKTQGSLPQEVVGELVHRFISDPDIKQIAEDNPEFKKDFDNFTGDKIYEVFPEYADVYIKNTLSRARELDGKNNWFANPIFDKSKYMDNLAEEVFKDRPILLKRVKDKFHNNWEHKIETTGIVDDLATGARGAMSGMWRSLKDVSGFGESYSDRIRNTLKEQYGHVETPHQNEFRKVVGEASNFMGMVLAMGATGSGLGNIGKGLGVMNPSVASKAVTLATFFDDELNHAASIYPENPTKAYLRASLSTAFFLVAGDAIPASKITGFKQNITQTLKSLETKALDKQAKMKLRDKILSVATETLQGTAKGTAEMTVMINGFKLLIDRALGLDESSINNEYSDANLLATAKSMLFGLPVPSMIHGFKGINRTRAAIYEMASNPEKYKSAILKRFGSDDHRIADIDFIADFKKYLDSMRVAENEKAKMVFNALHAKRLREQKSPDAFMKRNHEEEIRAIEQEQQDIMDGKDSDAGLTDSQKAIKTAYENGEINEMMEAQIKEALKDPAKADQFIKEIAEQATGAVAPELGNAKDGAIKFFGETLTDFAIGKSGKKGGGESVVFEYENEGEVPQKLKPLMVKDENGRITITMPKDEADALQKRIAEGLEPDMELMDGTLIKKADIKIKDVQDGRVKYKGEEGTIYQDGQTLVFKVDGKEKEYELGNVNDISDKPISELGIEQVGQKEVSVVSVADNGNVVVREQEYVNNYSDPFSAINRDSEGNVISVTLDTKDGKKRTFRGSVADDIAYQITLKEIEKNNETKSNFEQFINTDESKQTINDTRLQETAEKSSDKTTEPISPIPTEQAEALGEQVKAKMGDQVSEGTNKEALEYAIEKIAEAPIEARKQLGDELFEKVLEATPTEKLQEGLDFLIDKNSDDPNVKELDKIIFEREKKGSTPEQKSEWQKEQEAIDNDSSLSEAEKEKKKIESTAKQKSDPDLANIDPIIIAARNGDKKAQEKLEEYGLDWEQTTTYRFVGQSEVDVLLANNKVESKRGMADAGIDVTTSSKVTSAANNEYRVTFKESFDVNNGLGKVKVKSKEEGDHNLEKGRGYTLNDVAKIERLDENGNVVEVIYDSESLLSKEQPLSTKSENKPTISKEQQPSSLPNTKEVSTVSKPKEESVSVPEAKPTDAVVDEGVDADTKAQIENFGVPKEDVEATHGVISQIFGGLKKAGLTSAKTVGDWVGIGKGEAKPYTLKINGEEKTVKPVNAEVVNGFYSPLEKTINETKFDKLPAKQWIEKFARGEEAKWTGLNEWLSQQQGSVSKADIQKFLKENRIEVVEVVKNSENIGAIWNDKYEAWETTVDGKPIGDFADTKDEAIRYGKANFGDATKFGNYQLAGEKENYKEVLVTMPEKKTNAQKNITDFFERMKAKYGEGFVGKLTKEEEAERLRLKSNLENQPKNPPFKSSHWDEPSILVHLRMNTRTDAEGRKVLFVEEVQSDWGQKGKKEGFKQEIKSLPNGYSVEEIKPTHPNIKELPKNYILENYGSQDWVIKDGRKIIGSGWNEESAKENALRNISTSTFYVLDENGDRVGYRNDTNEDAVKNFIKSYNEDINRMKTASAPFVTDTNAWVKLALKTALKEAVAQGAERIAWSSGEQQFDRWGSEEIHWQTISKPNGGSIVVKNTDKAPVIRGRKAINLASISKDLDPQKEIERVAEKWGLKPSDLEYKADIGGKWNISVNEQTDNAQAFAGNEEALRQNKLAESELTITSKEQLRESLERNLARERNKQEIDKLTDRIWDRMQKEESGTSMPRREGMKGFYGEPSEGKEGIVGGVAKALVKELTGKQGEIVETKIETAKENEYTLGEANYVDGVGVYDGKGDMVAEFDTKKEAQDFINSKQSSTQHSIEITPELRAAVEKGQPLFKEAEAQYRIESGKNIIEAIKDFDGSPRATVALTHEIMHPTVVEIFNGAKEGNETGARHANTIVEEYNKANPDKKVTVQQMIEGNDAFINGRTTPEYRAVQEFIAEAWEKYHHEGAKGFSKAFQEVLDAITEVFRQVYKSLTGTTLTPELRKMFDELLGKENVSEVVKAPEISSKAKNKFSNLREKIKQKQSLKIVSDEAENRHANSKLTEADNPVQEPNVKALESEGENAKNAAQAENVIIKIDSIISAATDVGLRKVSDISTDEKRFQGRDKLNAEKVQEIAENWKDADQDPIHVWTDPKDGKTYVLSGHHRLAAAKQAGREKVKVIDRSKDFTEEQAIRFAKEEANANRTMETAIERANTLRQKRERGDTKDDINKFLDREGKNKNFVNNLSRLNPKGKTIEALRATEKSDDKVTQKEVEKIADWIGEARDRNKNLTDAHENELFDFLMDREGSKRITTKQDFLSKVNSLAGAMDFNANEPLNIARYKHKTEGEKLYDKEAETQKGKISDLQQRINEINDRIKNPNNPQYLNPDSKDYEEIKKNADNKLSELNTELQAESKALLDLYQQKGKFARQGTEQSSLFSTEKNETELPEDYYNDLRDIIKDLKDEHKGITLDEIKEIAKNELGEYYSEPDIEAAYKMTEPQPPKSAPEPPKSAPSRPDKSVLTNIVNAENTPPEVKKKLTAHGLKYDPESHDEALQIARAVIDSLGIDAAVTEARARNFGGAVNTFIQTEALNALYKKEAQAKTAQEKYEAAEKFAEVSIALDEWARGDAGRGISALATFYQKSPLGMVLKENKSRKEEFNQWAKGKEESWDEFLERLNKTPEFSDYVSEKVQTELREERKKERSKFFKKVDDTLDKWINDLESGNVAFSSVVPPKLIAEALKGVKAAFKVGESATKIIGDAIDYISDKIGDNWDKDTFRAKIEKALNLRAEKTSVDRYADSLKKQIEELQKQIDAGSRNKNQSNKRQLTPEEQSLLDEKKRLQKELNDIDPKTTFAQRIQKQIDDIQRQIDAGKRDEKERKNKKEYSEEEKELQEKLKAKKAELEALSPLKNTESYKLAELDKFREKLKGLSEAEKDEVVSKAYKKLLDNGALDHADLREIIAKATGRGNLTEKQAARLQELNETINAAEIAKQKHLKERTEQTLKEYHKAIDMAAKAKRDLANEFDKKTDYLKVISSSIQGNTLGLLNVAVMNPLYNITTHLALRLPIGTVQSLFGLALGKAEMNTVFGKPMQAEFFGKGGRGFREAFKGLLTGMNKADYESKEIFSSQIRPNRSLRALLGKDNREAKMKLQEKLFHTFSVFPGATAETNFRLLNFGDKPMRYSASAATAAAFAKKYGIKFNTMDWKTFMEFPREIVKEMELAKGKSLKEAEQEAEYVVRSIEKEGKRSTMQQDNFFSDMLEKVFSGGKHEGAKSLAKTLTISPFVKIPSNVLWLGYNLVHPQIALAQAAAHTIRSYGYRGKGEIAESKLQMREARYWMSVTMMGAALQAVMIPLIKAGIITAANDEDDSKKKRIADLTYQPQGMFNMTKFWAYLSGKNVNEVQGGFEIPLKYFGLPGALGNSLARDYKQLTPEQKENRRLLTDNLLELFDADDFKDIENGIFSSSSSLLQGLKGGDMTYYAGNMVNLFTNLIQPAAVSEFSRAAIPYRISGKFDSLGDKIKNDLSNRSALFRKLTGKYPKGKRNIWGEIIKKDDSYANRYFGFNNVTKDNFAQFIYEDAQKWDDEDFLPPTVSNSLGGKKLTAEQLDELEENIGLARKEFIRAYTNDIALIEELGKNYSDILGRDAKKAALQYLYQKGRKLGVDMFVSKHPEFENVVSEEEKQVEELLKNFKEINLISEDEINEKIKH